MDYIFEFVKQNEFTIATCILIGAYISIAIEKIPKAVTALIGASLIVVLKILDQHEAFKFIDFNVIFLLTGMMIIVNVTQKTGVFRWMALETVRFAKGHPVKILVIFSIITAVFSAFLDNVTTVLLMAPITLVVAKEQKISPFPYFISEILASNIGGTATLIGDPPNIMIGSAAGLNFMDFLIHLTVPVVIIFIIFMAMMYFIFRNQLVVDTERMEELSKIDNSHSITDYKLLKICLVVLFFVILGFIFHGKLHYEASTIAMAGASILLIFESPKEIIEEVEWTTIFFFVGLFIIIGGVEKVGLIEILAEEALNLTNKDLTMTTILILWVSAILSAIIDNIPYTATMIPMVEHLGNYMDAAPLWWALALGACLGGNGSIIGASANVIVCDISTSAGYPIRFMTFLKYGIPVMIMSLIISTIYLYIFYL
ncbi:MAG: ArsB/NhaD family transporter [Cyanobacteriota bacterium]